MRERTPILCVDDEPAVLEGLQDLLRRSFDVTTATSGAQALDLLRADPERFKIVISDMRMPVMTGATFLAEARRIAPTAVRMLLTGQSDLGSAVKAVNDGQIFRFLSKPCLRDDLLRACAAALNHHKLLTSRDALLDELTVRSVGALGALLEITAPTLHARGMLAQRLALAILPDDDRRSDVAAAALLGVLGEQDGRRVLTRVPRLEPAAALLSEAIGADARAGAPLSRAAATVRAVLGLDAMIAGGTSRERALATLDEDVARLGAHLLNQLAAELERTDREKVRRVHALDLRPGMTLIEDLRTPAGGVLLPGGTTVDAKLLERMRGAFADHGGIAQVVAA